METQSGRLGEAVEPAQGIKIVPEQVVNQPQSIILHLEGYVDTYNAVAFRRSVEEIIKLGYLKILFDLQRLRRLSSGGVGALCQLDRALHSANGEVVLGAVQPRVREVLTLLGCATVFALTDSVAEALERLSSSLHGAVFPRTAGCPICGKKLRFPNQGRFRCPECRTPLLLNRAGAIAIGSPTESHRR